MKALFIFILLLLAGAAAAQQLSPQPTVPKSSDWLNVANFGARGDSLTNDIPAFDSALAALKSGGGVIYVPGGRAYRLDSPWRIDKSNVTIMIDDGARLCFQVKYGTARNGIMIDSLSNVTIEGGEIIGDMPDDTLYFNRSGWGNGIFVGAGANIQLHDLKVTGFEYGIYLADGSHDCMVRHSEIFGNRRDGICIQNGWKNVVSFNHSYDNGRLDYGPDSVYGIWNKDNGDVGSGISVRNFAFSLDSSRANRIDHNTCSGNRGHGILLWMEKGGRQVTNSLILENTCFNNRMHGITVANAPQTTVQSNVCYDNNRPNDFKGNIFLPFGYGGGGGIQAEILSNESVFEDNRCFETRTYDPEKGDEGLQNQGINIGNGNDEEPSPENCIIRNNVLYNNKRFQKAVMRNSDGSFKYTHEEIDGPGRLDIYLWRDGQDNLAIDTMAAQTTTVENNSYRPN
ncbi:exported hypothetical protein [Candidatus Zixiibacteriota bacterium]|nr:exported hypothetical protein [candidate division Zixibacteria bacterium]